MENNSTASISEEAKQFARSNYKQNEHSMAMAVAKKAIRRKMELHQDC